MKGIAKISLVGSLVVGACLFSVAQGENHWQAAMPSPKPWAPMTVKGLPATPTLSNQFQRYLAEASPTFQDAFRHATAMQVSQAQSFLYVQGLIDQLKLNGRAEIGSQINNNIKNLTQAKGSVERALQTIDQAIPKAKSGSDLKGLYNQKREALSSLDSINQKLTYQRSLSPDAIVQDRINSLQQTSGALVPLTSAQKAALTPQMVNGLAKPLSEADLQLVKGGLAQTPANVAIFYNGAHQIANAPVPLAPKSHFQPRTGFPVTVSSFSVRQAAPSAQYRSFRVNSADEREMANQSILPGVRKSYW